MERFFSAPTGFKLTGEYSLGEFELFSYTDSTRELIY